MDVTSLSEDVGLLLFQEFSQMITKVKFKAAAIEPPTFLSVKVGRTFIWRSRAHNRLYVSLFDLERRFLEISN